jgi:CheY-like chemotaxis protein
MTRVCQGKLKQAMFVLYRADPACATIPFDKPAALEYVDPAVNLKTHCLLNPSAHSAPSIFFQKVQIMTKSILTISRNKPLQESRTLLLEDAGYHVSAALNDEQAIAFVETVESIDLVLLCHSVPEASRVSLVNRIKQLKPKLPILMLYNGYDPTKAKVDAALQSLATPQAMLNMVGSMTSNVGS